jgi:hypothetical protein
VLCTIFGWIVGRTLTGCEVIAWIGGEDGMDVSLCLERYKYGYCAAGLGIIPIYLWVLCLTRGPMIISKYL